ncbi:(2Fe-2S)-binding protein [Sedimentitalea sp. CY04]|uniref:(2Fe-2S)-binding protein n=1 Tax=Parasedimentitalea denitrificans TaxID=2211118 RepID=A0ABX0W7D4_9RHOB|nr:(2Fe-2S)-binding protein [Sedimentitalea sp. CY04]NIZ61570.1 (2Fe-2S)-binding protein [Sedimentitalea sp. CY04]
MKVVSRFYRLSDAGTRTVTLTVDGTPITAQERDSLAAALLAHSAKASRRTTRLDTPRTAYCMMGVCFDCLVEVDGHANVQACMTQVREGMVVRLQSGLPEMRGRND